MRYVICCVAWSTLSLGTALLPIDAVAQEAAHASTLELPAEKVAESVKPVKQVAKAARVRQTAKVVAKTASLQQELLALKKSMQALCAREKHSEQTPPEE